MTSLASLVEAVARRTPKALAVTDRSDSLTYGELSTASARAAASLENLGGGQRRACRHFDGQVGGRRRGHAGRSAHRCCLRASRCPGARGAHSSSRAQLRWSVSLRDWDAFARRAERAAASLPRATSELPTLFVACENDDLAPSELVRTATQRMGNATLEWIPRCGHLPHVERTDEFLHTVEHWLTAQGYG